MKIAPFYKWLNIKLTSSHYSGWFGIVSYTVFFPGSLFEGNRAKLNEILFVCLLFVEMSNPSRASITELISITEWCWPQRSFLCHCVFFKLTSCLWIGFCLLYYLLYFMHHSIYAVISTAWQGCSQLKHTAGNLKEGHIFSLHKTLPKKKSVHVSVLKTLRYFFLHHWKTLASFANSSH